ncbi:MAG: hypothetical protein II945_06680 [Bacteroidales bacterium]|nr:hypothetical protein [Bacteroidales bacterium]
MADNTTPLDAITDGYRFQQIVAEYFRCFKKESNGYSISNIYVDDSGIGPDDCCDILVEFYFEDAINSHSTRWVVECKYHKRNIGERDIDGKNIDMILKQHNATGYLLVCKKDASSALKRRFKDLTQNTTNHYLIWNGYQFWHKCIEFKSLLQAFFPDYYNKYFIQNNSEQKYNQITSNFEERRNK